MKSRTWWQRAVVYQIYPRSFADSTGNGVGDLAGITARLDHLSWLGVDALWLSPFFPSPMRDFGYDVSDYCDVDPLFGTLADFDAMVAAAHEHGLRVLIDWVPAHSSSDHPWFVESRKSRASPKRNWYVWRDAGPGGALPNNWTSTFTQGAPAWTWDETTEQYYLHSFLAEMPDLNWEEPELVQAMHDVLRFWLDRGVDGFRADVIHNIGKDPALLDHPEELARLPHSVQNDDPRTHAHLREIRALLDRYPNERVMVGEVFLLSSERMAAYYGQDDELHLCFNFPPLFSAWEAAKWRGHLEETFGLLDARGAWPTWVLSNHDVPRHRTRYGSEARARAAAVLLTTLRGTPFLYMGEELGLEDAVVPQERAVDPGGRDGCRAPLPWRADEGHGWGAEAWLPFPPNAGERSAARQREDPSSMLQLYRRLLALRRASKALHSGSLSLLESPPEIVAYVREYEGEQRIVAINFSAQRVELELGPPAGMTTLISSRSDADPRPWTGVIEGDEALVLQPR